MHFPTSSWPWWRLPDCGWHSWQHPGCLCISVWCVASSCWPASPRCDGRMLRSADSSTADGLSIEVSTSVVMPLKNNTVKWIVLHVTYCINLRKKTNDSMYWKWQCNSREKWKTGSVLFFTIRIIFMKNDLGNSEKKWADRVPLKQWSHRVPLKQRLKPKWIISSVSWLFLCDRPALLSTNI